MLFEVHKKTLVPYWLLKNLEDPGRPNFQKGEARIQKKEFKEVQAEDRTEGNIYGE